jgi:hypothetical protein
MAGGLESHFTHRSIKFDCTPQRGGSYPSQSPKQTLRVHMLLHARVVYMLRAMILLTISLSFSLRALTAFFLLTLAWAMTSSMSLDSSPVSSTSSPSSSSSSLASAPSTALPLSPSAEWSWPAWSLADWLASCWAAWAWAWELRSSILASPKMLSSESVKSRYLAIDPDLQTYIQVLLLGLL